MPTPRSAPAQPRKKPTQARSARTVDLVLEAAARILERSGYERFNTNAIAELAGVSPGSVYQFFPDKNAILRSLVIREIAETSRRATVAIAAASPGEALSVAVEAALAHVQERPVLTKQLARAEPLILMEPHDAQLAGEVNEALARAITLDHGLSAEVASALAFDVLGIMKGLLLSAVATDTVGGSSLIRKTQLATATYVLASVAANSRCD